MLESATDNYFILFDCRFGRLWRMSFAKSDYQIAVAFCEHDWDFELKQDHWRIAAILNKVPIKQIYCLQTQLPALRTVKQSDSLGYSELSVFQEQVSKYCSDCSDCSDYFGLPYCFCWHSSVKTAD